MRLQQSVNASPIEEAGLRGTQQLVEDSIAQLRATVMQLITDHPDDMLLQLQPQYR